MNEYLKSLLNGLMDMADEQLPGKTGAEKEAWVVQRLTDYVEVNDQTFFRALLAFTRLPVPAEAVDSIVDNKFTDAWQARLLSIVCKTAVRFAYGLKIVQDNLTRKEEVSPEEEEQFKAAEDALLKAEPKAETKSKVASKTSTKN